MWTVYCPFWVWKLLTLVFTDDDDEEDDELEFGSMLCSFFLSFSMCFSSRAAILSPRPLWDRVFLSRTAWASLRLLHKIYKIHSQSVYNTHITAVLNIQWLCWGSTHCWLFGFFFLHPWDFDTESVKGTNILWVRDLQYSTEEILCCNYFSLNLEMRSSSFHFNINITVFATSRGHQRYRATTLRKEELLFWKISEMIIKNLDFTLKIPS